MKFKFLYSSVVLAFVAFAALSFSSGPTASVGDKTGSPLAVGTCETCHGGAGSFSPTMNVTIIDDVTTTAVTNNEYVPGRSYSVKFQLAAAGAQFGIQTTALLSSNAQAGTMSNPTTGAAGAGTGAKITNSSGVDYMEHNTRSTDGAFNMTWVAPVSGSGNVTVYYAGLAINNDGSTAGDNIITGSVALTESSIVGSTFAAVSGLEYNVYPNPVIAHQFNIQGVDGDATISVMDISGRKVLTQTTNLQASTPYAVQLSNDLPLGVYTVSIVQENKVGTKKLILL